MLPTFQVAKRHALEIAAPPEVVFPTLCECDLTDLRLTRLLMTLRGYGRRMRRITGRLPLLRGLSEFGFTPLRMDPGREIVFGVAGKFWRPDGALQRLSPDAYRSFREAGFAKAASNFAVEPVGSNRSLLSTETRVLCFGSGARRLFRLYWALIEPFSGAMRRELLRRVAKDALERRVAKDALEKSLAKDALERGRA